MGSTLRHSLCKIVVFQVSFILELSAVSVPQFLETFVLSFISYELYVTRVS